MKSPLLTGATWLTLLALLAYYPIYGGDFLWDDYLWLWDNPLTTSPNGWFKCWIPGSTTDYYPITSMSFWLQWHLFGRASTGYQIINVLLLALGSIIIWRVLIALGMHPLWAWFAALLFILHPMNVASAGWISEQKTRSPWCFTQPPCSSGLNTTTNPHRALTSSHSSFSYWAYSVNHQAYSCQP